MDVFPLPFTDNILDALTSHEVYCFLDGFSGYNQVFMHLEDQERTTFVMEWGVFVVVVMMFSLKTAPATFQHIISEIFDEFIPAFMQVFLDDFAVYGHYADHIQQLQLCLDRCHRAWLSLNPMKCAFHVSSVLYWDILNKEGITMDRAKYRPSYMPWCRPWLKL